MIHRKEKSLKALVGTAILAGFLSGCSSIADLNPFGEKEVYLEGERKPLYEATKPASKKNAVASIGKATGGKSWPQAGGPVSNDPGNIAANVSGTVAWKRDIGKVKSGGFLNFGTTSPRNAARPVSDGQRIYVYKQDGELVSLSTNGARLFTRSLRPEGEDAVAAGGGVALDGGKVFVATAYRQVHALDSTGKILWTRDLDVPVRGAPTAALDMVFVVTQSNEVIAINQKDGSQAWSFAGITESAGLLASANPAISGKTVVVPFSSGEVMALDAKSGEPKWIDAVSRSFRTRAVSGLTDVTASPVVAGGTVIASSVAGRTLGISLKDGQRLWEADLGAVHTPAVSGNSAFLIGLDDNLHALDRKTGSEIWATSLPKGKDDKSVNWAGPILANGKLVLMSNTGVYAQVDAKTGQVTGSKKVLDGVFVSPIVAGGRMIVLTSDGSVAALQ